MRARNNAPNAQVPSTQHAAYEFTSEIWNHIPPDLSDPEEVRDTCTWFFDLCDRYNTVPPVSSLASALGVTRAEFTGWCAGRTGRLARELSSASSSVLQKALRRLEESWEFSMQNNGYKNPVTGIFLGKNNFGYKDVSESVVRHESAGHGPSRKELEAKYAAAIPVEVTGDEPVMELPEHKESN